jgi:hypothetical protein
MIGDIHWLALIQYQVIKLRRLAAEPLDRETSLRLSALADAIEQRTREADRLGVLSKIDLKGGGILRPLERGPEK